MHKFQADAPMEIPGNTSNVSLSNLSAIIDGNHSVGWTADFDRDNTCSQNTWLRITMNPNIGSAIVYTRKIRLYYRPSNLTGLIGAEIRVGNISGHAVIGNDTVTILSDMKQNLICATVPSSPTSISIAEDLAYFELSCAASGQFIFLMQPNARCMEVLELEVVGRRHGCTQCARGRYEDKTGSTACKFCSFSWEASRPWRATSASGSTQSACKCDVGHTGTAGGFFQDVNSFRPEIVVEDDGKITVAFNRSKSQFLHGPLVTSGNMSLHVPRDLNFYTSGGLTLAIRLKFTGVIKSDERLVDFGNSYADSIILRRDGISGRIVAILTNAGVEVCKVVTASNAFIVQNHWMALMLEYNASNNILVLSKDGLQVNATLCSGTPTDRTVTTMFVGKGASDLEASFNGEISSFYVAPEIQRILARDGICGSLSFQKIGITSKSRFISSENSPWWSTDLGETRFIVHIKVFGRSDGLLQELEGFDVRVGNWPTWEHNPKCASNVSAPLDAAGRLVPCQQQGRYVFIVLPGLNRTLSLCEVEVVGLNVTSSAISGLVPSCTSCIPGKYKGTKGSLACSDCAAGKYSSNSAAASDCTLCPEKTYQSDTGSTACLTCAWAWESQYWATVTQSTGEKTADACVCKRGVTGSGYNSSTGAKGLFQDTASSRPVYVASGGRLGNGGVLFMRLNSTYLHARQDTWNLASNGGLTIVTEVQFSGTVGQNERIIDFGTTLDRLHDSLILSRLGSSDQMYAAIFENGTEVCRTTSSSGTIVQGDWMQIIAEYNQATNTIALWKNAILVGGPTTCSASPTDRTFAVSYVGKSRMLGDANFNGSMSGLYVVDQPLGNFSGS